ncbi:MAG: GIY-YIG nuclease family protein, partial [Anaerolineae bacterium]|nr:GIY-YIG nuclease family protein [Anaerolineae bacterium]
MNLKDLLLGKNIDPQHVLVLRHRPLEPELNKVLPWLAAERPGVFNAYQQTQTKRVEQAMKNATHVAAF